MLIGLLQLFRWVLELFSGCFHKENAKGTIPILFVTSRKLKIEHMRQTKQKRMLSKGLRCRSRKLDRAQAKTDPDFGKCIVSHSHTSVFSKYTCAGKGSIGSWWGAEEK